MAQSTVATPRADWIILRMHYLRVVVPLAMVVFGSLVVFLGMSAILTKVGPARDEPGYALNAIAVVLSLFIALPVGASVFSRPFKEQHVLLFQALPVSRLRQWLLFTASSMLALLTVYAGMALMRPGAVALIREDGGGPVFAMAIAILYAAGLCFALVSVRVVSVYMSAFVAAILAPMLVALALIAPYLAYNPPDAVRSMPGLISYVNDRLAFPSAAAWLAAGAIAVVFTTLSAVFYVRGEMTLTRVQVRNASIVIGAVLGLAALTTPLVYGLAGGRAILRSAVMAPDGRNVVEWQLRRNAPWKSEIRVHDLTTGASAAWNIDGLVRIDWTARGELLTYVRDVYWWRRLWYVRRGRDFVQRWSPRGEELGKLRLDGMIVQPHTLDSAHQVLVVTKGDVARVITLEDGTRPRTVLETPLPSAIRIDQGIVTFGWPDRDSRAWRLTPARAHELKRAPIAATTVAAWVLDNEFYPDRDALMRKVEETWPAPRNAGARVAYIIRRNGTWIFALVVQPPQPAKLYFLDGAKQWRLLSDAISLASAETPREAVGSYDISTASSTSFGETVALFVERKGDRLVHRLHEPDSNRTMTFFERAAADGRMFTTRELELVTPGKSRVTVHADGKKEFEGVLHEERLTPLPIRPGYLLALWPDGTEVRTTSNAITIWNGRGVVRQVTLVPYE